MTTNYDVMFLDTNPYYTYSISLNKTAYNITMRYSTREACWYMDVKTKDNIPIILSVKLVPNYPMCIDFDLGSIDGFFFLSPTVSSNIYKFETEPLNLADYFQLLYVYET